MTINETLLEHQSEGRKLIGEVPFSVMARVAMQLGRESISNSIIAISELVKNAYDADAEKVTIRFLGLDTETPLLIIEDDGNGMTEDQLSNRWMVIGTSNKLHSGKSLKKHRILTGEKGLGRLGLDRLCQRTVVQSFVEEASRGVELVIEWDKYENMEMRLEKIKHDLYSIPKEVENPISGVPGLKSKGTRLILHNLKDTWTEEYLLDLKQELTLLVSPFAGINDFSVELYSGRGWSEVDGEIVSTVMLQAAEWKLVSEIAADGSIHHTMSSSLHDKVFDSGFIPWIEIHQNAKVKKPRCGTLRFEMYFLPRREVSLETLSFSKTQIEEFLDANQGIRVYRDNFRVKPYGEPDGSGDWLNLSFRRQQHPAGVAQKPLGGWRVGYNQVIGAVFISRDKNEALVDQTNRESIVEGPAFNDLKVFALEAVKFFEFQRQKFEMAHKSPTDYEKAQTVATEASQESRVAVDELANTSERIKEILTQAQESGSPTALEDIAPLLDTAVSSISEAVTRTHKAQIDLEKAVRVQQSESERQKDTLGNLASLGIMAISFGHESLASANLIATNTRQLRHDMELGLFMVLPDVKSNIEDNLMILIDRSQRIADFARFTLRNVMRDKRNRKNVELNKVISQVFSHFERSFDVGNIEITLDLPDKVSSIRAFQIDWESIILNLITNAIWALRNTELGERKIRVSMQESNGQIDLLFADSGCGISESIVDKIFLPTYSTRRDEKGEVVGTGMGLAIVKDFVESYDGGSISVQPHCDLGGAQFHIRVRVPSSSTEN